MGTKIRLHHVSHRGYMRYLDSRSYGASPAYYYTKNYVGFENRVAYQKHRLSEKLDVFDQSLTEWENMTADI